MTLLLKYFIPIKHSLTEITNKTYEKLFYLAQRFDIDELYNDCRTYMMKKKISPSAKLFERVWNTKDKDFILKLTARHNCQQSESTEP